MNLQSNNFLSGWKRVTESRLGFLWSSTVKQHFLDFEQEAGRAIIPERRKINQVDPTITLAFWIETISGWWRREPKKPDSFIQLRSWISESSKIKVSWTCEAELWRGELAHELQKWAQKFSWVVGWKPHSTCIGWNSTRLDEEQLQGKEQLLGAISQEQFTELTQGWESFEFPLGSTSFSTKTLKNKPWKGQTNPQVT